VLWQQTLGDRAYRIWIIANWQCSTAWARQPRAAFTSTPSINSLLGTAKRDYAMLAMLFGCGFRRSQLVSLELDEVQMRQGHWAGVDLIGKGGHIRTVPIPLWVKPRSISGRRQPGSRREEFFEPSPGRERYGGTGPLFFPELLSFFKVDLLSRFDCTLECIDHR